MAEWLVLDTSVLVPAERGAVTFQSLAEAEPESSPAISVITVCELLHGYHRAQTPRRRQKRERFIRGLLARLEVISFDLAVAREHARIWADLAERGKVIGPHDLIIAATAIARRAPLATLNVREFRHVKGLSLIPVPLIS